MNYSRRQLYAMGEAFGDCATAAKPGGGRVYGGGGGGSSSTTGATTETTNVDQRMAIQDGVGVNGDGNSTIYSVNSSDAVVAIANAGADVIKQSGGAVVDIYKNAGQQNSDAWNKTITTGAALVDKLIDKVGDGFDLSKQAISSFTPVENKNTDAIKWVAIAAAVAFAATKMGKKS
jgi:hypothetical protein